MLKKIILAIFFIYILLKTSLSFAVILPEDIFSDVNSDYKYYEELKTLVNKWFMKENNSWKFDKLALITRKEFIWYMVESNYKKCIQPNTDDFYKSKNYSWSSSEIAKTDDYFYCLEYALENNYFSLYEKWHKCEDWTVSLFCQNDKVSLEEAIYTALISSNIYSNSESQNVLTLINSSEKSFADLSPDLKSKNLDWTAYKYYPFFEKAISYDLIKFDNDWNLTTYNFFDYDKTKNISPKKAINREDLIRILYIVSDLNNSLYVEEKKLPKDCSKDEDLDWINDCLDACPTVKGDLENNWCRILDNFCNSDCSCQDWFVCSSNDTETCSTSWICLPKDNIKNNNCLYKDKDVILFWKAVCNSCPCSNYLDFTSDLRKCDIIFPAITSVDQKDIYSKWDFLEIK